MELREAFSVLEIEEGSSLDDAKTAYRRLCIGWHQDRFQNPELERKRHLLGADLFGCGSAALVRPCNDWVVLIPHLCHEVPPCMFVRSAAVLQLSG